MLVGHPGVGKTRSIRIGREIFNEIPESHLAPISMTWASLVDTLVDAKRYIINPPAEPIDYNMAFICADELGTFITKYDNEMIDGLAHMYDPGLYDQTRRTGNLRIKMAMAGLNMLVGSTPQNLTALLPEKAWGQGFMSRVLMVFSDERIIGDDFADQASVNTEDLAHDLLSISTLSGPYHVTQKYRDAVNEWRASGEPPVPGHPKLTHYNTRRRVHLYKLSMVAAVDRGDALVLDEGEFFQALAWLTLAEEAMPDIFKAGAANADAQAMDEIVHYVMTSERDWGVSEEAIRRFAQARVPIHSILRVVDILERSGQLRLIGTDKNTGIRYFTAKGAVHL